MTDHIEPALSAEEWARLQTADYLGFLMETNDEILDRPAQAIAVANAALPDTDPRKITREMVATLRDVTAPGSASGFETNAELTSLADALESYLPPPAVS